MFYGGVLVVEARERSKGERLYLEKLQRDLDAGCNLLKMWPRVMTEKRFKWMIGSTRVEFSVDIDCSGGEVLLISLSKTVSVSSQGPTIHN